MSVPSKKILYAVIVVSLVFCRLLAAEEKISLAISVPEIAARSCSTPVWNGVTAVWEGVKDERESKEVGTQEQKKKDPILVMADPPLEGIMNRAVKEIFEACGMKLVHRGQGSDSLPRISAEIMEFYVGVTKKLVTGTSQSIAKLKFNIEKDGLLSTVTMGTELDSKGLRSKNITQLKKSLNILLSTLIENIPGTDELKQIR